MLFFVLRLMTVSNGWKGGYMVSVKHKSAFKKIISAAVCLAMLPGISGVAPSVFAETQNAANSASSSSEEGINDSQMSIVSRDSIYSAYYNKYKDTVRPDKEIVIEAQSHTSVETGGTAVITDEASYNGIDNVVLWENDGGTIEWEFEVAETGIYNLEMYYHPIAGNTTTIEIELAIDGKAPFDQANYLTLDRYWKNEHEIQADSKDNQSRPPQIEYDTWLTYPIKDKDGIYNEPYFFYLEKGKHTISLTSIKMRMALKSLRFYNSDELVSYESIKPTQEELDNTPAIADGKAILVEAENASWKTSSVLYPTKEKGDYLASPANPVKERYNTLGLDTWNKSTQTATWKIIVPADGYYSINMRARQNTMRGLFSNRRLYIDGKVPFDIADNIRFNYSTDWYTQELTDTSGDTAYIYLTAGDHEISLEATPGDLGETMQRLDDIVYELNYYYRRILMITGPTPNAYQDYNVHKKIDNFDQKMQELIDKLYSEKAYIEQYTTTGSEAGALEAMAVIIERMKDKPRRIPQMLESLRLAIASVSAWMRDFRNQPLELDYIELKTVHDEYRNADGNFFEALAFGVNAFVGSFFEDYNNISDSGDEALNVWISLSRDQATIVKELTESTFTPTYGIKASINLVIGTVLEATLAGKGPDISLFLGGDFPVNLAARDLIVDLTQFPDYDEVSKRFTYESRLQYAYTKNEHMGVYGLPITQTFPMLFYRKDILSELGYDEPPETWDDLFTMLTDLQRKHLSMGLILPANVTSQIFDPGNTFAMLMLQTGQDFYNENQSATTFDTPAALEVFKTWTEFYTNYRFDKVYDAFSRFRTGEMPLVIQGYTFYNQLNVAAPEIKGLWDFAVVPGTVQSDGTISHAVNSAGSGAVIFNKVKNKDDAWTFIKWFTSTETQVEYGKTQEAVMGPMGRFDTANLEALPKLSWSTSEYELIAAQQAQLKEIPIIPASYVVTRNVNNAFQSVINLNDNPRFVFTKFNEDINREIERKRKELGLDD